MKKLICLLSLVLAAGIVQADPISAWCFEGSGTTVTDNVGSNDGTMSSGSRIDTGITTGPYNHAFDMAGTGGVVIPDAASLDTSSSFTVQAWLKPDAGTSTTGMIAQKYTSTTRGWQFLYLNYAGAWRCQFNLWSGTGWNDQIWSTSFTIAQDEWTHVAVVFNDDTDSILFYRNGVNASNATTNNGGWSGTPITNDNPIIIGVRDSGTDAFTGEIDEFAIFNYAVATGSTYEGWNQSLIPEPTTMGLLFAGGLFCMFKRKSM